MGNSNILLDKFTDNVPTTQEGFEQILLFMLTYRHNLAEKYKFKDVKKYIREEQFKNLEEVLLREAKKNFHHYLV